MLLHSDPANRFPQISTVPSTEPSLVSLTPLVTYGSFIERQPTTVRSIASTQPLSSHRSKNLDFVDSKKLHKIVRLGSCSISAFATEPSILRIIITRYHSLHSIQLNSCLPSCIDTADSLSPAYILISPCAFDRPVNIVDRHSWVID